MWLNLKNSRTTDMWIGQPSLIGIRKEFEIPGLNGTLFRFMLILVDNRQIEITFKYPAKNREDAVLFFKMFKTRIQEGRNNIEVPEFVEVTCD